MNYGQSYFESTEFGEEVCLQLQSMAELGRFWKVPPKERSCLYTYTSRNSWELPESRHYAFDRISCICLLRALVEHSGTKVDANGSTRCRIGVCATLIWISAMRVDDRDVCSRLDSSHT